MHCDGIDDIDYKPAFATSDECPELADTDGNIMAWWRGKCIGVCKRRGKWYVDDDGLYRYPMKMMTRLR
jgi:hypothetical protein